MEAVDPWHDVRRRARALHELACTGASVDDLYDLETDPAVVVAAITLLEKPGRVRGTAAARYNLERLLRRLMVRAG